ncbi:hypothetical protein D3C86_1476060 [compost metagenome]
MNHFHDRPRPLFLGSTPAATRECGEGIIEAADDHQVQRIAVPGTLLVGDAARQRLQRRLETGVIRVVDNFFGWIDALPEHFADVVIGAQARHDGQDREMPRPPVCHQIEVNELEPLVEIGQHEARGCRARWDRVAEGQPTKVPVERSPLVLRDARGKCFGRLGCRVEIWIEARRKQVVGAVLPVFDFDPDWLYRCLRQRHTVDRLAFCGRQYRGRHAQAAIAARHGAAFVVKARRWRRLGGAAGERRCDGRC